jgi:hypothetical protein
MFVETTHNRRLEINLPSLGSIYKSQVNKTYHLHITKLAYLILNNRKLREIKLKKIRQSTPNNTVLNFPDIGTPYNNNIISCPFHFLNQIKPKINPCFNLNCPYLHTVSDYPIGWETLRLNGIVYWYFLYCNIEPFDLNSLMDTSNGTVNEGSKSKFSVNRESQLDTQDDVMKPNKTFEYCLAYDEDSEKTLVLDTPKILLY